MRVEYWINDTNGWQQVSFEEYSSFDGEKETRWANRGLIFLQSILQQYRY